MAFGRVMPVMFGVLLTAGCHALGLAREYEYDERVELALDGSAVVDINASIPSLVALRGMPLQVDPEARFDRDALRRLYEAPGVGVREVSAFRRHGRRFVHIRLDVSDVTALPQLPPLSWSRYQLHRTGDEVRFVQEVGPAVQGAIGDVGWTGRELVAFRLRLPSRINFHNSPIDVERGNTLVWEQALRERLSGAPLRMEARAETETILYRTLWLFGGTFAAALAALAMVVWWIGRKGRSVVPA
jgi:hypothetical protein